MILPSTGDKKKGLTGVKPHKLRTRKTRVRKQRKFNSLAKIAGLITFCLIASFLLSLINGTTPSSSRLRSNLNAFVQKHELAGYGPHHPRAVFVLVANSEFTNPIAQLQTSVKSILSHTDRNRILTILPVLEKTTYTPDQKDSITKEFAALNGGTSTHRHGDMSHVHDANVSDHDHGDKIRVYFSESETSSVAASRREAALYAQTLLAKYESIGLKSKEESVLLVFVHPGVEIESDDWLDSVTQTLIVPSKNPHRAVSLSTSPQVETISFDVKLNPLHKVWKGGAIANGANVDLDLPTSPLVEGSVTALTLDTFLQLPVADDTLDTHSAADLELSLNLWLCKDGVEVLPNANARKSRNSSAGGPSGSKMSLDSAVRLVSTWMSGSTKDRFLQGVASLRDLELETIRKLPIPSAYSQVSQKCRTFDWFVKNIATGLKEELSSQGNLPSKPLSKVNKDIISTAKPVNLEYVDVSNGFEEHPHKGAMDENGVFGYVHDAAALHKAHPDFEITDMKKTCETKDGNYKMLTEKVFVDTKAHEAAEKEAENGGRPRDKIFCLVYTIEANHDRLPPLLETWMPKCDGSMIASTKTDKSLGTVNIPHEGPEEYNNIWQKVRSMWSYIYDNYYEDYDWFHIGGDDLFIIVENLRLYLESEEIQLAANGGETLPTGKETAQVPLFLGRRFKEQGNWDRIFNSGGAGYTMNKAALKALVVNAFPTCMPHHKTFAEDVMVAQCFRNKLKVFPFDTKDETGGERYMPFAPAHHLTYKIPKDVTSDWYSNYSIDIKEGLDHCAAKSVAFHYIKGDLMKRMYAILYGYCK